MTFAYLNDDRLRTIRAAFNGSGKEYTEDIRDLLMTGIAPEYVQKLRNFESNYQQLFGDLERLNSRRQLANGQVPLKLWIKNAIEVVFSGLDEEKIFQEAIKETETPADPDDIIGVISEGLEALRDLIKDHPAVIIYRNTFETAVWEFDVIASYKFLHDALHKVQLDWPETSVVKFYLTQGELMKQTLLNKSTTLNTTCAELRKTYNTGYVDRTEGSWIAELEGYQVNLEKVLNGEIEGITDREPTPEEIEEAIKNAFSVIEELLTTKLNNLNVRLKDAIKTLHLGDLIKAMNKVCEQIKKLSPDNTFEQIQQYKAGVDELSKLEVSLKELIQQHDAWQNADTLLRALGKPLKKISQSDNRNKVQENLRLANLVIIKNALDESVGPLLADKVSQSAERLKKAAKKFNDEIERSETDKAEHTFEGYRQQAWHYFFEIDTEMKNRCDELRVIGRKLRKVNDQLKFNEELDL